MASSRRSATDSDLSWPVRGGPGSLVPGQSPPHGHLPLQSACVPGRREPRRLHRHGHHARQPARERRRSRRGGPCRRQPDLPPVRRRLRPRLPGRLVGRGAEGAGALQRGTGPPPDAPRADQRRRRTRPGDGPHQRVPARGRRLLPALLRRALRAVGDDGLKADPERRIRSGEGGCRPGPPRAGARIARQRHGPGRARRRREREHGRIVSWLVAAEGHAARSDRRTTRSSIASGAARWAWSTPRATSGRCGRSPSR